MERSNFAKRARGRKEERGKVQERRIKTGVEEHTFAKAMKEKPFPRLQIYNFFHLFLQNISKVMIWV